MRLNEFDVKTLSPTSCVFILGKRYSGKTQLLISWAYELHKHGARGVKFDMVVVFSKTEKVQNNFSRFVPKGCIHNDFNEQKINELLDLQHKLKEKNGSSHHILLILDDIAYKKGIFKSETFSRILFNGRHANICVVCTTQYCMNLPPEIRSNLDVVVSMREPNFTNRKKLYDNFYGHFSSFKLMDKVLNETTDDYGALIAVNNGLEQTNELEKNIFWYRADVKNIPKNFNMGRDIYWSWTDRYLIRNKEARLRSTNAKHQQVKAEYVDEIQQIKNRPLQQERRDSFDDSTVSKKQGIPMSFLF
jgi:hypothetical protein